MPPTADIATPDRFRQVSLAWLLAPILLVAAWTVAEPHHGLGHQHLQVGLAGQR